MNNYIILNKRNSRNIKGLLIQKLAPITKAKIRTNIEEIDGKNGDEIIKLGYASYDKEILIGLSYDYDVDEIINFFNSEGEVIFSNEPDKIYNYSIIDQIDFEKLLNYKIAKVKLHIQPFKYSILEPIKQLEFINNKVIVRNNGNIYSNPVIHLKGKGTINLYINEQQILKINLDESVEDIIIDTQKMEAYNPTTKILKNRMIIGNYEKFKLLVGKNEIKYDGIIEEMKIQNYSRWI